MPKVRIVQEMSGPYKDNAPWPRPGEVMEVSDSEAAALTHRDPHSSHSIAELVTEPRPAGRRHPRPEPAAGEYDNGVTQPAKVPEKLEPVKSAAKEPELVKPAPAPAPAPQPVQARATARGDGGTAHK